MDFVALLSPPIMSINFEIVKDIRLSCAASAKGKYFLYIYNFPLGSGYSHSSDKLRWDFVSSMVKRKNNNIDLNLLRLFSQKHFNGHLWKSHTDYMLSTSRCLQGHANIDPLIHTHHPHSSQTGPKASRVRASQSACQDLFKQKQNITWLHSSCPAKVSVPAVVWAKRAGENEVKWCFLTSATSQCRKSSVNVCSVSILQPPCTLSTAFLKKRHYFFPPKHVSPKTNFQNCFIWCVIPSQVHTNNLTHTWHFPIFPVLICLENFNKQSSNLWNIEAVSTSE